MNEFSVIAVLATLFALRFIAPLALSLGICRGMCRLLDHLES